MRYLHSSSLSLRPLTSFCFATIVALAGAHAYAQEESGEKKDSVRYQRESKLKVEAKESLDTKFKQELKKQEDRDKRKVEMLEGADFAKQRAAVQQQLADAQIGQLQRLLQATDRSHPDYPDLVFRLADHFLEKKAYFELQAGSLYEPIYQAEEAGNKAQMQQLKAKQASFESEAKKASGQAVKLYEHLVTIPELAKYHRIDEALYFYAFELGQLGRAEEMKAAYVKLIQDYPNSKYIPNAYLSFADYYFGQNQIGEALKLYEKVITFKDSPVYAYALYKMAWCHLNPVGSADPRYDLSLQYFVDTIEATLKGQAGSDANAKQLRRDARRDLVQAYAQQGRPSKAWDFFSQVGNGPSKDEDMARSMMELLAVRYFGSGFYTESSFIYNELEQRFPEDPATCEWQGRVVINALATDKKDIQWKETAKLGDYWRKFRDGNYSKAAKQKCHDETLDTMKQMATVWHDEAEKTRNVETYALAEQAYEGFLSLFPKDKDAYDIQLYYAELIWSRATQLIANKKTKEEGLEKFRKAHKEFVKVLELNPNGKYTQDAAYAQMLAMKNALEYDETGGQGKACQLNDEAVCVYKEKDKKKEVKKTKETEIDANSEFPETDYTPEEKEMLNAYDIYSKFIKDAKDKELPKIVYHRAKLMMEHNKFDEARPLLEEMITKFDGTTYAAWCSAMLLDLLTIKWLAKGNTADETVKASEDLETWAARMQKMQLYSHPEAESVRQAIPTLLAGIRWKKGLALRDRAKETGNLNDYKECAESFLAIYNDYGKQHEKADTLIWNAATCYEAAYLLGQAVRLRKILLEEFPTSEHYQASLDYLGGNYQSIAMYERASEYFESYADKYPKDEKSPDKLQNAYLFRLGLGENEKAQENLRKFEDKFKKKDPQKAARIFWSKIDILKSDEEKLAHAKSYLQTYGKTGGLDRQIVAEATIGQILWRQSCSEKMSYDSCITITRKVARAGEKSRERARDLKRKTAKTAGGQGKKVKLPERCGSATSGVITVHPRNAKLAAEAQKHFDIALSLAKNEVQVPNSADGKPDQRRLEDFRNAVAMAQVYKADKKYEEYLQIEMPSNLSFYVEEWKKDSGVPKWEKEYRNQLKTQEDSKKRFKNFYDQKTKIGRDLHDAYGQVVAGKQSPYWMLAAAARSAMVSQNYADQLYRAEVPSEFKTEEEYYAFCDALGDQAQPIQEDAQKKFSYCLDRSTNFQFFNEFSRLCEDELQQREPDKYPSTNELFGTSKYTSSHPDHVGVQIDIEGGSRKVPSTANNSEDSSKKPQAQNNTSNPSS